MSLFNDLGPDQPADEKITKLVTLTVAAVKGIIPLGQATLPLAQIAHSPLAPDEARALARVLNRLLRGERDPIALVEDLPPAYAEIVWEALAQIEAPLPDAAAVRVGLSLTELIEKVALACAGEVMLWQQLWQLTGELSADERLPAAIRALGDALRRILAGERQAHVLDGLADEHRPAVAQLLDWLNREKDEGFIP